MTRIAARAAVATIALVLMVGVAPALAAHAKRAYPDTPKGALDDCGAGNDPLKDSYSIAVLEKALSGLSTENAQYSTCADALQAAIRADEGLPPAHHHHKSTTGAGKTTPPSVRHHHRTAPPPTQPDPISQRISAAVSQGRQPQRIQGVDYVPGAVTTHGSSFLGSIPTPILAVLAALLACLAALAAFAIRNVVRARRTA